MAHPRGGVRAVRGSAHAAWVQRCCSGIAVSRQRSRSSAWASSSCASSATVLRSPGGAVKQLDPLRGEDRNGCVFGHRRCTDAGVRWRDAKHSVSAPPAALGRRGTRSDFPDLSRHRVAVLLVRCLRRHRRPAGEHLCTGQGARRGRQWLEGVCAGAGGCEQGSSLLGGLRARARAATDIFRRHSAAAEGDDHRATGRRGTRRRGAPPPGPDWHLSADRRKRRRLFRCRRCC